MKRGLLFFFVLLGLNLFTKVNAQQITDSKADKILSDRNEVCFNVFNVDKATLGKLTKMISVDRVDGNQVFAYANRKEFSNFLKTGLLYELVHAPGLVGKVDMCDHYNIKSTNAWDTYPTYPAYEAMMNQFVTTYPELCRLVTIGTLTSGRKILALKIATNPDSVMNKPRFLYTSSIHGDEITGYPNMLRMIDYLLSNYGTNAKVTNLVNNIELYINPLANPDGTYHGGNASVNGATRSNANGVDLNRNYPDPKGGPHPDGNAWQPETVAFMAFGAQYGFDMSVNFHGGAEVLNYPWDTYVQIHADDAWWIHICRGWADTTHLYSPASYLSDLNNGITNGNAWYEIEGGRQDYTTYFLFGREMCAEISNTKLVPAATLPNYWNYNYRSLLNYLEECLYSVRGIVTDSVTGAPLKAKIFIAGHDIDSSFIYSRLPVGDYHRYLAAGTFNITYSCPGYYPKTLSVNSAYHTTTIKDVQLVPITSNIIEQENVQTLFIYPNPARNFVVVSLSRSMKGNCNLEVVDTYGRMVLSQKIQGDKLNYQYPLDLTNCVKGLYFITVSNGLETAKGKLMINQNW
jgi:hypothetical protein